MVRLAAWLLLAFTAAVASGQTGSPASALAPNACVQTGTVFCANHRFGVSVIFSAPSLGIPDTSATAVGLTNDTGYFWFFSLNNVELVVKVVDGRAFNGYYWVFFGALTDVAYTVTVTDAETGAVKRYTNPAGTLASVADPAAFSVTTCTYDVGSPNPSSFGRFGGGGSVSVTTQAGCSWTAVSNSGFIYNVVPSSSTGSGSVNFSVAVSFSSLSPRSGTLTVAGETVQITQTFEGP